MVKIMDALLATKELNSKVLNVSANLIITGILSLTNVLNVVLNALLVITELHAQDVLILLLKLTAMDNVFVKLITTEMFYQILALSVI